MHIKTYIKVFLLIILSFYNSLDCFAIILENRIKNQDWFLAEVNSEDKISDIKIKIATQYNNKNYVDLYWYHYWEDCKKYIVLSNDKKLSDYGINRVETLYFIFRS